MLTATDLTGEETHEKKNPRFLLLILAVFIMAGIGYAAFWWINKQENIVTAIEEKPSPDPNAQAWYEEQKRLMEAKLNIQPNNEIAVASIDSLALDSAAHTNTALTAVTPSPAVNPEPAVVTSSPAVKPSSVVVTPSPAVNPSPVVVTSSPAIKPAPAVVTSSTRTIVKPETTAAVTNKMVATPKNTDIFYEDQGYKPVRSKKTIADNIKPTATPQYFQEDNQLPTYNGSIPPTNNKRPVEPAYIPVQRAQKETEKNAPAFYSPMITRDELEEFMRQFPYKKTTIHFVCYSKPNEEMEAIKAQIIQFLRQNGYTDMETQWSIWLDHTPVKELHYGKSGLTGANFYIPSFK